MLSLLNISIHNSMRILASPYLVVMEVCVIKKLLVVLACFLTVAIGRPTDARALGITHIPISLIEWPSSNEERLPITNNLGRYQPANGRIINVYG